MTPVFDGDALFWFYSVLAQVFASMLALVGLFVVYRLQDQRSKIRDAQDDARETMRRVEISEKTIQAIPNKDLVKSLLRYEEDLQDAKAKPELRYARQQIETRMSGEIWVRKQLISPLFLMTVVLVASVVLLPLHKMIGKILLQKIVFFSVLGLAVSTIIVVAVVIYWLVNEQQKQRTPQEKYS